MLRIVADTNVLMSAILFTGVPHRILELAITGRLHLYISPAIVEELQGVLVRPKFGLTSVQVTAIVAQLLQIAAILVHPTRRVAVVKDDPDDNIILECALECQADAVVSGDRHPLDLGEFERIPIQSPSVFLSTCQLD